MLIIAHNKFDAHEDSLSQYYLSRSHISEPMHWYTIGVFQIPIYLRDLNNRVACKAMWLLQMPSGLNGRIGLRGRMSVPFFGVVRSLVIVKVVVLIELRLSLLSLSGNFLLEGA